MEISGIKLLLSLSDGTQKIINLKQYNLDMRAVATERIAEDEVPVQSLAWRLFLDGMFTSDGIISTGNNDQTLVAMTVLEEAEVKTDVEK